ncbi:hypothetical protein, partial [Porphyromonas levii]|uniref:hypothetical protein n=1 Tax=Porphyromonas levii TaxID=28114 RepID=UPI001B8C374F
MKKLIICMCLILFLGACSKSGKEHYHKDSPKALEGKIVVVIDSIPNTQRKELLNSGASSIVLPIFRQRDVFFLSLSQTYTFSFFLH